MNQCYLHLHVFLTGIQNLACMSLYHVNLPHDAITKTPSKKTFLSSWELVIIVDWSFKTRYLIHTYKINIATCSEINNVNIQSKFVIVLIVMYYDVCRWRADGWV